MLFEGDFSIFTCVEPEEEETITINSANRTKEENDEMVSLTYEKFDDSFINRIRVFLVRKMLTARYDFDIESREIFRALDDALQRDTGIKIADYEQCLVANRFARGRVQPGERQVSIIIYRPGPILWKSRSESNK